MLNVVINCSFGMPTDAARSWLSSNGLADALSPGEEDYLVAVDDGVQPDACGHQLQIEAMWTLAWALSLAQEIDWGAYCADALASWLPDLRSNEGSTRFRTATAVRAEARVLDELDTAFCLSWGCAESNLRRLPEPGGLPQYVVWERRRALEWLVGDDWDDPDMST